MIDRLFAFVYLAVLLGLILHLFLSVDDQEQVDQIYQEINNRYGSANFSLSQESIYPSAAGNPAT